MDDDWKAYRWSLTRVWGCFSFGEFSEYYLWIIQYNRTECGKWVNISNIRCCAHCKCLINLSKNSYTDATYTLLWTFSMITTSRSFHLVSLYPSCVWRYSGHTTNIGTLHEWLQNCGYIEHLQQTARTKTKTPEIFSKRSSIDRKKKSEVNYFSMPSMITNRLSFVCAYWVHWAIQARGIG